MKRSFYKMLIISISFLQVNISFAQNPLSILNNAYELQKEISTYKASYLIRYKSDIDTGSTTVENINIICKEGKTKISNDDFINLSDKSSKLYIDMVSEHITYIPIISKSEEQESITNYFSFYIPQNDDDVSLISDGDYYKISIRSKNKNINFIEYLIDKNDQLIKSIKLQGQVHPILLNDLNAEFYIEVKEFKYGDKINLDQESLSFSNYLVKSNGKYILKKFKNYQLEVLE